MKTSERKFLAVIGTILIAGFYLMGIAYMAIGYNAEHAVAMSGRNYLIIVMVLLILIILFLIGRALWHLLNKALHTDGFKWRK